MEDEELVEDEDDENLDLDLLEGGVVEDGDVDTFNDLNPESGDEEQLDPGEGIGTRVKMRRSVMRT